MHVTLHMTTGCNMNCSYCYAPHSQRHDMSAETARKSIDFIAGHYPHNTGIIFFGGEPLLRRELLQETLEYAEHIERATDAYFHYKVTINGLLLDDEFVKYATEHKLQIALSIDGNETAHNTFRLSSGGKPTFDIVRDRVDSLMHYQPYTKFLMTVSPATLPNYADSVEYLLSIGIRYLIVSLDYSAAWSDKHIVELKKQYKIIAKLYEKLTEQEKKFYYSPFEMKLAMHIRQDNLECYRCHFAKKQLAIAHDGDIYPCVQFVQDGIHNKSYSIGNILSGLDDIRQNELYSSSLQVNQACRECAYNDRCNNKCSCLNWQTTGDINGTSAVICETERVLIPIADKLGARLFKRRLPMFIQKHYNAIYPILSMMEDMMA